MPGSEAPLGLAVGLRAPHLHINEDIYKLMHLGPESQLCSCRSSFLFSWESGVRMRLGILPGTGRGQFPGEPQGAPGTPRACPQLVGRSRWVAGCLPPVGAGVRPCSATLGTAMYLRGPVPSDGWESEKETGGQWRNSRLRSE